MSIAGRSPIGPPRKSSSMMRASGVASQSATSRRPSQVASRRISVGEHSCRPLKPCAPRRSTPGCRWSHKTLPPHSIAGTLRRRRFNNEFQRLLADYRARELMSPDRIHAFRDNRIQGFVAHARRDRPVLRRTVPPPRLDGDRHSLVGRPPTAAGAPQGRRSRRRSAADINRARRATIGLPHQRLDGCRPALSGHMASATRAVCGLVALSPRARPDADYAVSVSGRAHGGSPSPATATVLALRPRRPAGAVQRLPPEPPHRPRLPG